MPLYKKMGFTILKEKIVQKKEVLNTDADIEVPLMVRMPSFAGMTFYEWRERGYPALENPEVSSASWSYVPLFGLFTSRIFKMISGLFY
jgi:hypothetical protein